MKTKTLFTCSFCDAQYPRWAGRCAECGKWNTIEESTGAVGTASAGAVQITGKPLVPQKLDLAAGSVSESRLISGITEFDQVLGGGIVPGAVVLLAGDPGIGKSTLALQIAAAIGRTGSALYVSGEESPEQVRSRAVRLGLQKTNLQFVSATDVDQIIATAVQLKPSLLIVDSVQTAQDATVAGIAGAVGQVRSATARLAAVAKQYNIAILLLGHITKEGSVAGPKTLEHLVDVVLLLSGDQYLSFRTLRGTKNRFGSTNEVGIFEMRKGGMIPIANPSEVFLADRHAEEPGQAIYASVEGRRGFLGIVQALVSKSAFSYPRRAASGFDVRRLELLVAVLTRKASLRLDDQDIYVNVVGGIKVQDPSIDLAVALAIASSLYAVPVDKDLVALGEVGLTGEVRSAHHVKERLKEVQKIGFKKVILAERAELAKVAGSVKLMPVTTVAQAIFFAIPRKKK